MFETQQPLSAYRWSSYPLYLAVGRRPGWLRVDRLLGEHGLARDDAAGRREFARQVEQRRREGDPAQAWAALRRGWKLGAADFVARLAEKLGRAGRPHELARERDETDEQRAEGLVQAWLAAAGWTEGDLAKGPKAAPGKIKLARELRRQTPMTRQWIAQRLHMGSASYVSHLAAKSNNYRL